jgi:hypothetical protein
MAKTILILGAGASIPYGFPSGEKLVESIKEITKRGTSEMMNQYANNNNYLPKILHEKFEPNFILGFNEFITKADPTSIDQYIAVNSQFLTIGKYLIAYLLLEDESKSIYDKNKGENWYKYLMNEVINFEPERIDFEIYTFNYERSLENYIEKKIRSFYSILR